MTKEELKVMIDNTINSNGKRSITGKSLNLALTEIINCIGEEFNNRDVVVERNDVNFFDYDGTLLYSYTWEEAKNLTELPEAPSHEDMNFVEWNYTLEDIKEQGMDIIVIDGGYYNAATIKEIEVEGEIYKGILDFWDSSYDDESIWICVTKGNFEKDSLCYWAGNGTGTWVIDRDGDGIPYDCYVENFFNYIGKADIGACYEDYKGNAVASPRSNVLIIPRGVENIGTNYTTGIFDVVSFPNTLYEIDSDAFNYAHFLNELKIPWNCYVAAGYCAFNNCYISSYWHNKASYLEQVFNGSLGNPFYIQDGVDDLISTFSNVVPTYVIVPNSVYFIDTATFDFKNYRGIYVDFSKLDHIPACGYPFSSYTPYFIIVPDELYDEWVNATNWSSYAEYIHKASEYNLNIK